MSAVSVVGRSVRRQRERPRLARRSILDPALAVVTSVLAAVTMARDATAGSVYAVVPERSRAVITVGKAGALSFIAGHTHEVHGPIRGTLAVDLAHLEASTVEIAIQTADLVVTGKGEPPQDVPKVQETMVGPAVLDVARYPTIRFRSTSVAVAARNGTMLDLSVTGELTMHGETKQVSVPVHAEVGRGRISAQGTFSVKQSDYGIRPPSVAGVVSVRDALDIHFTVVAAE